MARWTRCQFLLAQITWLHAYCISSVLAILYIKYVAQCCGALHEWLGAVRGDTSAGRKALSRGRGMWSNPAPFPIATSHGDGEGWRFFKFGSHNHCFTNTSPPSTTTHHAPPLPHRGSRPGRHVQSRARCTSHTLYSGGTCVYVSCARRGTVPYSKGSVYDGSGGVCGLVMTVRGVERTVQFGNRHSWAATRRTPPPKKPLSFKSCWLYCTVLYCVYCVCSHALRVCHCYACMRPFGNTEARTGTNCGPLRKPPVFKSCIIILQIASGDVCN